MAEISTLVEDIYKIFAGEHKVNEENLEAFCQNMKEALRTSIEEAGTKDTKQLRMSIIGLPDRKIYYMANSDIKQKLEPYQYIKFVYGHIVEQLVVFLAKEAGHSVTDEQKRVEIEGVKGSMDCKIDGVVTDIKSASGFAIKKFENDSLAREDSFGYIGQISGYAEAEGQNEAAFVAVNKENGQIVLLKVDDIDLIAAGPRIKHIKGVLEKNVLPEKCYEDQEDGKSGNRTLSKDCSYCPFKFDCWRDSNNGQGLKTYAYSNGPKYFTKVVKEPRVDAIA